MAFSIKETPDGHFVVDVVDEPDFIVGLKSAPAALEDELKSGKWVVVSFSLWSVPQRELAYCAIEIAKRYSGCVQVGLRPYDYPEECFNWIPEDLIQPPSVNLGERTHGDKCEITIKGDEKRSPIWVAISEGSILSVNQGKLGEPELTQLFKRLI